MEERVAAPAAEEKTVLPDDLKMLVSDIVVECKKKRQHYH